jgi:Rieske Fe-S protein
MGPGDVKPFAWGSKPGILKKNEDGALWAFVGVCTHLDCNVAYKADQKKFFCACHDGWYDEFGKNIAGPPSTPLRRLSLVIEGQDLIIKKEAPA